MKKLSVFCCLLLYSTLSMAQPIPNGCFSAWADTIAPFGWTTSAKIFPGLNLWPSTRDVIDKTEGSASVKLTTVNAGNPTIIPGILALGSGSYNPAGGGLYISGIPFNQRPNTLKFAYKYEPNANDSAAVEVGLMQANGTIILSATIILTNTNGQWQYASFPLQNYYQDTGIPDTLKLIFFSSYYNSPGKAGSTLHIDQVNFDNVTETCQNLIPIKGKAFWDINQNAILDNGELPVIGAHISLNGNIIGVTGNKGTYVIYADKGQHTIKLLPKYQYQTFDLTPDSLIIHIDSNTTESGNNNFAIIPAGGFCEGNLSSILKSPPRPGFQNNLGLHFDNLYSAAPVSPTINLQYNASQKYLSAIPVPTYMDTVNHIISWNTSNIQPGSSWLAEVVFYTPPVVTLGSIMNYIGSVNGSACAGFDSLTCGIEAIVIGSYDPNDKSVSPPGAGPLGNVSLTTGALIYTIRFQNTGTYLAETVRIEDTISANINLNSLEVIASSHNYEVLVNGRQVTFQFNNINLPDSNSNEPGSHGYVQYRAKLLNGLSVGAQIKNTAYIFFDFNAPIVTNTTITTLVLPTSIQSIRSFETPMVVYPNPNNGKVLISVEEDWLNAVGTVTDLSGRKVIDFTMLNKEETLDLTALSTGVYVVRIVSQSRGHCSQKLHIQK